MKYAPLCMTFEEMYEAVLENDASYDSIFFYAVKSTGIYCRPSCKSKAPKKENVEFFTHAHEARAAGYRACKRCRSDLLDYQPMQDMAKKLKKLIDASFAETANLHAEMDAIGLSRKRMVEIFKEEYGITPSQYMNDLRYSEAQKLLTQSNNEIIDIAYSVGFGSLSAFYKFFKERAGMSPAAYRNTKISKQYYIAINLQNMFLSNSVRILFGFQIKIASYNFNLSATAKAWFRLASRSASHFGCDVLSHIPILNKNYSNFYLELELQAKESILTCLTSFMAQIFKRKYGEHCGYPLRGNTHL